MYAPYPKCEHPKLVGVGEYFEVLKRFNTSFVERADEEERKRERKRQRKSCSNRI